ncbi:M55 family metallopeptidase [Dongia sp.]|uniref:M55 family metallopeptidase n=1 Tax=Dongia sp. TaxID=1977262 RepID=UPI0035B0E35C
MRVFISSDIEGTAGITHWDEAEKAHDSYPEFRELMTGEVLAAIEGALDAGATEILLKDAHDSGRNIITEKLPPAVKIIRGWSGHPLSMVQGIDEGFDAVIFTGYHSRAGSETNPLAHTMNLRVQELRLNGIPASEFHLHATAAAYYKVPAVFISGDKGICEDAAKLNPGMVTVAVSEGIGRSTISVAPSVARARINEGVKQALKADRSKLCLPVPDVTVLEVVFNNPTDAYRASWYPGAKHIGHRTVQFAARDFFEVMRAQKFILGI